MAKANTEIQVQEAEKGSRKKTENTGKAAEKSQKAKTQATASGPLLAVEKAKEFKTFLDESRVEMKKVTWPTRKETVTTSVAVLILVVLMSLFLGIVDLGLSKLVEYLLS